MIALFGDGLTASGLVQLPIGTRLFRGEAAMSGKRAFPYYSEVPSFELQKRRLDEDPSR